MSAVLHLIALPGDDVQGITRAERGQAASWAARQSVACGGSWWVETHLGEEGDVWLGVVTPSSLGRMPQDRTLTWLQSRRAEGIVLFSMPSGKTARVVRTIAEALTTIARAEKWCGSSPTIIQSNP